MLGEELATHDTRRYRIVRSIATGGMAQVFEAVWERPGGIERRVALKRMLPEHASDASLRALFFDEARIVSRLVHPNVVQLLDFGMVEGAEFHVLELVDGLDAGEAFRIGRANEAPLGVELATFVMAEVAEALAHAHALTDAQGRPLGIVHRDVSPSNVLVSWSGDVKLGDFGIALGLDRTERVTRTGLVRGKEEFMAR
ncbi:MAG: protein kinase [Sandaracinus sp.]|nr:protein kinase [Sandaracinus sp.]